MKQKLKYIKKETKEKRRTILKGSAEGPPYLLYFSLFWLKFDSCLLTLFFFVCVLSLCRIARLS